MEINKVEQKLNSRGNLKYKILASNYISRNQILLSRLMPSYRSDLTSPFPNIFKIRYKYTNSDLRQTYLF
jgi:hypothetical protein